ncbi:MAG: trypsin-like peptidase domain-containing protein [Oscillospiraceae bacterium]|jgi:serine protease Do|nr:trypsin-like peptidase domain-containing protein [Oscillospiraceae bacterium]
MNYNYEDGSPLREGAEPENTEPKPEETPRQASGPVTDWKSSVAELIYKTPEVAPVPEPEVPAAPERTEAWRDPAFSEYTANRSENAYSPGLGGSYYTPPRRADAFTAPEPPRDAYPRRRGGFLRAACLVLACVLFSAAATYGVTEYRIRNGDLTTVNEVNFNYGGASPASDAETSEPEADDDAPVSAPVSGITGGILTGQEIYNLAISQVVGVTTTIPGRGLGQPGGAAYGSGFIITPEGFILTNYHVVEDAIQYGYDIDVVMYDGTTYSAVVKGYEADNDVAVIKIDAVGLNCAVIGKSADMQVGEMIYAVGNPRQLNYTMTDGIVSALDRSVTTETEYSYVEINMFQISAAVNSGNSGGPVYNTHGEVLGIVSAKYVSTGTEGLGFAIPIDDAMSIAYELISKGHVTGKASLGVRVQTVSAQAADYYDMVEGAYVKSIDPGTCAEKAGVRPGDIIIKLGDKDVTSTETLKAAKKDFNAGDSTTITVNRDGEELTLSITFDEESVNAD